MATYTIGTEAANMAAEVWNAEFGLDPTEEMVAAGWVAEPESRAFGNLLHLRKLKAYGTAGTLAASDTGAALTAVANTDVEVTVSPSFRYFYIEVPANTLTRVIQDTAYRNGLKKQGMAALNEARDSDIFALASGLSSTLSVAAIDEAAFTDAFGTLALTAKGKMQTFNGSRSETRLFIHPSQISSVLRIPGVREYRIRGAAGSAVSGEGVMTNGCSVKESGLVLSSGGSYYNVLCLPDAFALAHNVKPTIMQDQQYQLQDRFIGKAEWGVSEWFDSSGVAITTP